MTGDFTSVPLRPGDPWTGARLQQGRVLLDGDFNLVVDGAARERRRLALGTIGPAGVAAGSPAFQITVAADSSLQIGPGLMWVGGLATVNPDPVGYLAQESPDPLPASGRVLVYLDAQGQEVAPAELPQVLLDPALDGVDTMTRTRVAWRVRAVPTTATSCAGAAADLPALGSSSGRLDVVRTTPAIPPDPCAPPDDPRGKLPDGLLRVEVLDSGSETTARFAWSYENGSAAVAATVAGTVVTCAPSPATTFFPGDLVEVSTLLRRADRRDNGPLFTVDQVTPGAGGEVVTLTTASAVTGTPSGLCLRRWDGEVVGAAGGVAATLAATDVGVAFTARPGTYLAGDWWGVRVRGSSSDAVQALTDAPPEGTEHELAALAVVDLDTGTVLSDCRPEFVPLTQIRGGTCTVTVLPGEDLQAAADRLPAGGGELCLAAGVYRVDTPVVLTGKSSIVVTGIGPATVVRSVAHEAVLQFTGCTDVTVRDLRVEGGPAGGAAGKAAEPHLLGALTFLGCTDVTVRDCEVACPDNAGRDQSAVYAAPAGEQQSIRIRVLRNKLEVGDQQVGVLVVSADEVTVEANEIRLPPAPATPTVRVVPRVADEISRFVAGHVVVAAGEGGHSVQLPGQAVMRVHGASQVQRLADQFGRGVTVKALARATPRQLFQRYTRRALLDPTAAAALSKASGQLLTLAATTSRAMAQGIVVGGTRAPLVRISGNLVVGAIQGVHVGLGGAGGQKINAGEVILRDNVVAAVVPFFWTRSRHAYYVGSVARLTMLDNSATLTRNGATPVLLASIAPTPVEAVRVHGRTGPWLSIRGLNLAGPFTVGVAVTDLSLQTETPKLKYVSDVVNAGGGAALVPPTLPHDRCVP